MPFMENSLPCKRCGEANKLTRIKYHKSNGKSYLQSTCKECEAKLTKAHQKANPEKWRAYNHKSYFKNSENVVSRRNNMEHTSETRAQWARDKANRRCSRAKQAKVNDEFTKFVTSEAHDLRRQRDKTTGIEWHVDHIIPLRGIEVCGLHIWSNLAVIPKVENLRKGNKNSIHV